jgi:hypothetical protein
MRVWLIMLVALVLMGGVARADKGSFNCTSDNESGHGEKNGACDDLGF